MKQRLQGSIRERTPGVWQVTISLGRQVRDGRVVYPRRAYTAASEDEAYDLLLRLNQQLRRGDLREAPDSLAVYLRDWLEGVVKRQLAPNTYDFYRLICERHLIPALGPVPLNRLGPL